MKPYSSARDEYEGVGEVFLDANENGLVTNYNRYPDPLQHTLKEKISSLKGIPVNQLMLGNGSDEVLDLLFRLTSTMHQDSVAYLNPSYGMYSVLAKLNGLISQVIDLNVDFTCTVDEVVSGAKGAKLLILCNPNNPTGRAETREWILDIVRGFDGVVVVDEAYSDFCPEVSVANEVLNFPNLIVAQTLSKAFGMAGLRVGMAIAHPNWIKALNSIKPPYNLSEIAQEKALELLSASNWSELNGLILSERERVVEQLQSFSGVTVFQSASNFVLFRVEGANELYLKLVNEGIIIRNRGTQFRCENCLRVSIGSVQENDRFITAITNLLKK